MPDSVITDDRPYHHGSLRATLLDAAETSLRRHGAEQLSLRELAREAGVSHAAPRRHFPDRQALLDALAERGFERMDEALTASLDDAGERFAARLEAVVSAYIRFATRHAALLEVMYRAKHREGATRVVTAAEGPFGLMNDLIQQGQEEGALGAGDPMRVGVVLFSTMHGIATLINGEMIVPELLDGLVETAVQQFLRGARPGADAVALPQGPARMC